MVPEPHPHSTCNYLISKDLFSLIFPDTPADTPNAFLCSGVSVLAVV